LARTAVPTDYDITANDVADAKEEARAARKAWDRLGCRRVTNGELRAADDAVAE
jgi:hypothetical protein